MKTDTWEEHALHFVNPDPNCSDCFAELPDCRYSDCQGDGKVHHGGDVNVCDMCSKVAEGYDAGI